MGKLKFYKTAAVPTGTTEKPLVKGAVWFNSTEHTISVYDGAKWEVYTGLINAVVEGEKLTITKWDGSTVSVDFSVYATDEALSLLTDRVSALEGTVATHGDNITDLQGRMTTVEGKAATAEGQLAGLSEATVMAEIAKQVAVADDRAVAKENELEGKITALETTVNTDHEGRIDALEAKFTGEGSVESQITEEVEAAEARVQAKLDEKVNTSDYEAYVEANDAAVAAAQKTADDEVVRAMAAEAAIDEKIGVPSDVDGVTAYSKDYTVGQDVKAAKDAAAAAQKTIDDFLTGEGVDPDKVDALKEIIAYMEEHGEEYEAVVENLNTLNSDVATLKGDENTAGSVAKAVADAEARVNATIEENEKTTAAALTDLDGRVEALEGLSAGTEISDIKSRLDTLETEVNTNIPQDIADAQAAAEATAAADATTKANTAESNAKEYADGLIAAEVTRSNKYADDAVAVEAAKVSANATAIAELQATVEEGFSWVVFE